MSQDVGKVLLDHANWLVALFSFCLAFRGIVLKHADASAPLPWYFFRAHRSLYGAKAVFAGCLYLVAGVVSIASVGFGVAAILLTASIAWVLSVSEPRT